MRHLFSEDKNSHSKKPSKCFVTRGSYQEGISDPLKVRQRRRTEQAAQLGAEAKGDNGALLSQRFTQTQSHGVSARTSNKQRVTSVTVRGTYREHANQRQGRPRNVFQSGPWKPKMSSLSTGSRHLLGLHPSWLKFKALRCRWNWTRGQPYQLFQGAFPSDFFRVCASRKHPFGCAHTRDKSSSPTACYMSTFECNPHGQSQCFQFILLRPLQPQHHQAKRPPKVGIMTSPNGGRRRAGVSDGCLSFRPKLCRIGLISMMRKLQYYDLAPRHLRVTVLCPFCRSLH